MNRKPPFYKNPSFLSFVSGVLLTLSFPGFYLGFLAWIALVPFFFAMEKAKSRSQAIGFGLTLSLTFFLASFYWLMYVTVFGWVALAFLESAFFLLFSLGCYQFRSLKNPLLRMIAIALAWTTVELVRAEVPAFSMGINLLAYSQAAYAWVRMVANTVGAYGLGFAIAFANLCVFEIIRNAKNKKAAKTASVCLPLLLFFLLAHGFYHYSLPSGQNRKVRVSLVQGNIPQSVKWEVMAREEIIQIYSKLTEIASYDQPDLIVWPEAAYPGYFNRDRDRTLITELVKKTGANVLIGSPHLETENIAFNSAYLLDSNGEIRQRYDKHYLVPFGEYVPLGPLLGWLKPFAYSLGVSDFSEGHEYTVFRAMNGEFSFSALICFEDFFPNMARQFVRNGAQFLAVITNDAWFGPTAEAYQHEQASVFRAIENGVPVVRAANTGVSSFISYKGDVLDRVRDNKGRELFVTAKKTYDLPLDNVTTLFGQGGWIFPYIAAIAFVIILLFTKTRSKK